MTVTWRQFSPSQLGQSSRAARTAVRLRDEPGSLTSEFESGLAVGNDAADAPGMLPELYDTESFETADAAAFDSDTLEALY